LAFGAAVGTRTPPELLLVAVLLLLLLLLLLLGVDVPSVIVLVVKVVVMSPPDVPCGEDCEDEGAAPEEDGLGGVCVVG
jgi:hypothetical protein